MTRVPCTTLALKIVYVQKYSTSTALQGYTDTDAHMADCCDGTAQRHTCESNYCRSSGRVGLAQGVLVYAYRRNKASYPQEASSGSKISINWDQISYMSDPNQFIFMWQHYPRCACYDEDGQKFDAKDDMLCIKIAATKLICFCRFGCALRIAGSSTARLYIYGQAGVCNTAITVCTQFADITVQGDSSMSPVTLSNNCTANTGTIITDDQSSTTNYQENEN